MQATLTELRRETSKVIRPVINGGEILTLTEHGQPCAKIIPVPKVDRLAALAALRAIGPVTLPKRK
jgi:prevent-host-death family protein